MATAPASTQPSLLWALFSLRGRISRRTFWLVQAALISVNSVLFAQLVGASEASFYEMAETVAPFVAVLTLASNLAIAVKRLHDFDTTGLLAAGLLVPLVNIFVTVWVGVVPSDTGPNRFGSAPDSPV